MKPRACCAMIVGDDADKGQWIALCESLENAEVEKLYVNYNGKQKKFPYATEFPALDVEWKRHRWVDNFSKARQQSFAMVDREEFDWVMWVDSDDCVAIRYPGALTELLESVDPFTQQIFCKYDYGVDQETGDVIVEQWRERIMRTDGEWRWRYIIHEVCHGPAGTQLKRDDGELVVIKHHRQRGADDTTTRRRNRKLLMKARKEFPREIRYDFYLANEIFAEAKHRSDMGDSDRKGIAELAITAIELYNTFIRRNGAHDEDSYQANHRIAECYRVLGDYNKAIDVDMQGIKIMPTWPESYIGIARSFMGEGDWEKMKHWAEVCLKSATKPETSHAKELTMSTFAPLMLRGIANQELGNTHAALEDYAAAYAEKPDKKLKERMERLENIDSSVDEGGDDLEKLRKSLRNEKPDRSIAFLTRPLFEPWNPKLLAEQGAGGAETCIMKLAPKFAADGWRVVVFGTPGDYRGVDADGIEWWDSQDYTPSEEFTVVVGSRTPEIMDADIKAKVKLLWMHDVNSGDVAVSEWGNRFERADGVIALTGWHKRHLHRLYGIDEKKIFIVPNGVDATRFDNDLVQSQRDMNRFFYSSSPDRGLDVLLGMWPEIKRRIPDAELKVFYGWEAIDKIIDLAGEGHPLMKFKIGIEEMLKHIDSTCGGIDWVGRIPQGRLAYEMSKCGAWLYPTYFLETFCITAIEAQLAGALPVTSSIGALPEVIGYTEDLIAGWPNNDSYREHYVDSLMGQLESDALRNVLDINHKWASQFTWDASYRCWLDLLESTGVTGITSQMVPQGV